ncbi:hypothetical protein ACLBXM_18870 [Xanthobacteraceae bacterium A53D]
MLKRSIIAGLGLCALATIVVAAFQPVIEPIPIYAVPIALGAILFAVGAAYFVITKPHPKQPGALTFGHLEILHHHLMSGVVWDGDQISKVQRNDLLGRGLLRRLDGGFCSLTYQGAAFIMAKRPLFLLWSAVNRINDQVPRVARMSWGFRYRMFAPFAQLRPA